MTLEPRPRANSVTTGEKSVLIVEDDADSRYVYGLILEDNGFRVATARSGDEGLRLARELQPQAILMDVSIPGMDGWTVTKRLKSDPNTAGIPVIIITAHAFPEDLGRAEHAGCEGFLTKPCEPRRVLEEVRRLVRA
jgi:two-component system cell cycle response regulator DivK